MNCAHSTQPEPATPSSNKAKVLVSYFSAANTTKPLAEYIADGLDASIYEIVPERPYTSGDLNYGNSSSHTTLAMNDPGARNLHPLTNGAAWLDGQRFSGGTSCSAMIQRINVLGPDVTAD